MILGLGSDAIDIRRIGRSVERFGERFLTRIYTETELRKAKRRQGVEAVFLGTLAKRFAAKEAASKALGTGFRRGVFWRDLGVVNLPSGQPTVAMTGGAAERLRELVPVGMVANVHLTMTDEFPYAHATVIISASPAGGSQ